MVYKPPLKRITFKPSRTEVEEVIHKYEYAIKRMRFTGGDGKVFIYRYNKDGVAVVLREYTTHRYTEMRLYDMFSNALDNSHKGEDFEDYLQSLRISQENKGTEVVKLSDILSNIQVTKE